jgi:anti-sigma regulatory factor (Ser/Thr protein kinase)
MPYAARQDISGPSRPPVLSAGVWWLPMSWDVETEAHQAPASAPGSGSGDPLRDMSYTYTTDLAALRAVVYRYAKEAGLPESRALDLVLAVSEVAANTVRHAKSPGSLKIWYDSDEIVCQIQDEGTIHDPLAGQRKPAMDAMGGHGLWIVHQVCDDVEMDSDEEGDGTTIRLHMKLPRLKPGP